MSSQARNYSISTLKKLFALSGNKCAFPGCSTSIVSDHNMLVGEICHIEAANEGGERFNPNITDKERASFENLILMCSVHHTITNNESIYTVEKLKEIKHDHEAKYTFTPDKEVENSTIKLLQDYLNKIYTKIESYGVADDLGIINDIFHYLIEKMPKKAISLNDIKSKHDLTLLRKKVLCNFPQHQFEKVSDMMTSTWERKELVKGFLQRLAGDDEMCVVDLKHYIRQLFCEIKGTDDYNEPINDIQFITKLSQKLLPPNKNKNPQYFNSSNAIVFYFFEFCDIGKLAEGDKKLIQGNLFE